MFREGKSGCVLLQKYTSLIFTATVMFEWLENPWDDSLLILSTPASFPQWNV